MDELADPHEVVRLAVEAESSGWDGFFVWDHIRWREPVRSAADPWIVLAAVAAATERLRIGPMVTPPARRRPAKLARETATLDQLSGGRLVLGVGIGSDDFGGEYSRFGEEADSAARAAITDETLEILRTAWSGDPVRHQGTHHVVDVDLRDRGRKPHRCRGWCRRVTGLQRFDRHHQTSALGSHLSPPVLVTGS